MSLTRERLLAAVEEDQTPWRGGLYLRGSLVRDEPPFDDIDVFEVGFDTTSPEIIPNCIGGVRIEYAKYKPKDFSEFLGNCPRAWYMFFDARPISSTDEAQEIFDLHKEQFFNQKLIDYLAFLAIEDTGAEKYPPTTNTTYEYAKNLPGSKRTIMRVGAMVKVLYPELVHHTTPDTLSIGVDSALLPESARDSVSAVATGLCDVEDDISKITTVCENNVLWTNPFRDSIMNQLAKALGSKFVEIVNTGLNSSNPKHLRSAIREVLSFPEPWRKWNLAFALAHNPRLSDDCRGSLGNLFEGYPGVLISNKLTSAAQNNYLKINQ